MSETIICRHCAAENPLGSKFCNNCGTILPVGTRIICPNCQTANPRNRLYCDNCGTRLVKEVPPTPEPPAEEQPGVKRFDLPMRPPGDTGELDPTAVPDWLRTGRHRSESDADPPDDSTPEDELPPLPEANDELPGWLVEGEEDINEVFAAPPEITTEHYLELLQGESSDEPEEIFDPHAGEEAELPDWLAEAAEPAAQTTAADEADEKSWLDELGPAHTGTLESPDTPDEPPDVTAALPDLPDWLADIGPAHTAQLSQAEEADDEWLDELEPAYTGPLVDDDKPFDLDEFAFTTPLDDFEESDTGPLPDWLANLEPISDTDEEGWDEWHGEGDTGWRPSGAERDTAAETGEAIEEADTWEEVEVSFDDWDEDTAADDAVDLLAGRVEADTPAILDREADEPDWLTEAGDADSPAGWAEDDAADVLDLAGEADEPDWLTTVDDAGSPTGWAEDDAADVLGLAGETDDPDWLTAAGDADSPTGWAEDDAADVLGLAGETDDPDWLTAVDEVADSPTGWAEDDAADVLDLADEADDPNWLTVLDEATDSPAAWVEDDAPAALDDEADELEWLTTADDAADPLAGLVEGDTAAVLDDDAGEPDWPTVDADEITWADPFLAEADDSGGEPDDDSDWLAALSALSAEEEAIVVPAAEDEAEPEEVDQFLPEPDLAEGVEQDAAESEAEYAPEAYSDGLDFEEMSVDEEIPEWISQLGPPAAGDTAPLIQAEDDLARNEDLPEWLTDMMPGDDDQIGATLSGLALADPDYIDPLEGIPEELAGAELPDWLQDAPPAREPGQTGRLTPPPEMGDIPDWLRQAPEESEESARLSAELSDLLGPPVRHPATGLSKAEIPDWVQALKPTLLTGKTAEAAPAASSGPLSGIAGALAIEPVAAQPRTAVPNFVPFSVSKEQRAQVNLLTQIIATETESQPVVGMRQLPLMSRAVRLGLALLLLLSIFIGLWGPPLFASPATVTADAVALHTAVDAVAGQPVLLVFDYTPALAAELDPQATMLLQQLAANGSPVIGVSQYTAGERLADLQTAVSHPDNRYHIGYLPGEAIGIRQLAACLAGPTCEAVVGRSLPSEKIEALADVSLVIILTGERDNLVNWIEQLAVFEEITLAAGVTQSLRPVAAPYLASGQLTGLLAGLPDIIAYQESLLGLPAAGNLTQQHNAQGMAQLMAALLLLVGLLVYARRT